MRFEDFGSECVAALDMINGGQYEQRLGNYWLTKLPDVIQRLENGGRVLDVGCGVGLLALRSRRRSLNAKSLGSILNPEVCQKARETATSAGVQDRIRFVAKTTHNFERDDGFDLITACDCVHDLPRPIGLLLTYVRC